LNIADTKPDADAYRDELVELRKVVRQQAEQADHCLVGYSIEWIAFAEAMQGRFDCKDAVNAPLAEG
jgi:hypothetical protein